MVVSGEGGCMSGMFFFSSRRRHTRYWRDWSSDVCSSDLKPLLERVRELFERLSHLWLDAGYNGKGRGKDWVEKVLGLTVEVVRHPPKPRYVWVPEGHEPDWEDLRARGLLPPVGFKVLPRHVPLPHPRSRRQVPARLRRHLRVRGGRGGAHSVPRAECQRLRGAVGPLSPRRMPRPSPDRRRGAPAAGADGIRH